MGVPTRGAKFQISNHGTAAYPLMCFRQESDDSYGIFYGQNPIKFSFNIFCMALVLTNIITRTLQILLRPLRQPIFVIQLLGGIVIGPSLLGQSRSFSNTVFPLNCRYVLRNLGLVGFMLWVFVSGVKLDMGLLYRSGKKHFCIAIISVFGPLTALGIVGFCIRKSMDSELARVTSIGTVALTMTISAFPIQYAVLEELNLISSEVGIMALSVAFISDSIGMNLLMIFEQMKQKEVSPQAGTFLTVSAVVLLAFLVTAVRRTMLWIIKKTPEGKPVEQLYVVSILLFLFVMGFLTDMFGLAICNGPFLLGLVIPDGPPLGSTLVEKSETMLTHFFLPCTFAFIGLNTDFYEMREAGWTTLWPMFAMMITGILSKFVSTLLSAKMVGASWRDSLALGLVLSLRGHVELTLYVHWIDKNIIELPCFSMLVLGTAIVTGILTPLISILYDPTKPYMVNQRRTIQHTAQGDHLRIIVCVKDKKYLPSLVNLLTFSYPTVQNPFSIYTFYLVELLGRSNPLFVDHQNQELKDLFDRFPDLETIQNALEQFQEGREESVELNFFSAKTVKRAMFQDICKLALISKTVIIIIPIEKKCDGELDTTEQWGGGNWSGITLVLDHAPCSVGLFIDKADHRKLPPDSALNFIVLFLGGPDSREALAYSDRIAGNPRMSVTLVRFLPANSEEDDEMQKKMDDGLVTWFWVKNERNERVSYREVVVRNGEDTASAIVGMAAEKHYHMWIVGRKQGINPSMLEGLSTWSENKGELGIIGDYVLSSDIVNADSVLVFQKQLMRGKGPNTSSAPDSIANFMRQQRLFW